MAHFGGWVDDLLMRFIEVINSLPNLLLVILFMMVLGNNLFALLVALSITAWCNTARQVRGMIKQLKESEYVYAAEVLGASPPAHHHQALRAQHDQHPHPRCLHGHPNFIFTEAGLSF